MQPLARFAWGNGMTKTEIIRDAIRYIKQFKNSTIVIRIDDGLLDSPLFAGHIHDLALLFETGIKIVIVPGAKHMISRVLDSYHSAWRVVDGIRITDPEGMDFIKMAAFDVSNRIMSRLAAERLHGVIGNWVSARGRGVVNGVDFGSAGLITRVDKDTLERAIGDGFIPIIPCVGWTAAGKSYNISSVELAVETAALLRADKLFFLEKGLVVSTEEFTAPENAVISPDGRLAALSVEDVEMFIEENNLETSSPEHMRLASFLRKGREACLAGVARAHILNGAEDGVVPGEIFSDIGAGTMIYRSNYGTFRKMSESDVPAVLSLMHPFVEKGVLLPRSEEEIKAQVDLFTVYEIDGGIRACAALKPYTGCACAEIAAVAVDDSYACSGIGPALMHRLIDSAGRAGCSFVFVLTTQALDWFERFGFKVAEKTEIPEERVRQMDPARGSKILTLQLHPAAER